MTAAHPDRPAPCLHRFVDFPPSGPVTVTVAQPGPGVSTPGWRHRLLPVSPRGTILVGRDLSQLATMAALGMDDAVAAGAPGHPDALAGIIAGPGETHTAVWAAAVDNRCMRQLAETRKDLVEVGARDVFAAGDPAAGRAAARAVSLVRNKTLSGFDPATGQPVQWDGSGGRGTTAAGGECFARINPCVIGLVKKPGEDKILLGRNAVRSGYFSALAGYCEPGETLEQAFMREVFEESGVTITGIRYVSSQPWPDSGSLMVAFTAVADPSSTPRPVDGELAEVGWFSARQISSGRVPLPRPGSVARRMIDAFAAGELIIGDN